MSQLMPLPFTVSCFSKIQTGFTFLVPAHLGSPRKRAVKRVCVCWIACCIVKRNHSELLQGSSEDQYSYNQYIPRSREEKEKGPTCTIRWVCFVSSLCNDLWLYDDMIWFIMKERKCFN